MSVKQGYMPAIGVPTAWKTTRGDVIVAIVDNGIEFDHPDLAGQIWTNPNEQPNGLDDDGNGFTDDVHGWDFLDNDADPSVIPASDDIDFHGTAVAGVIAAATDNGVGVAGNCPDCRLMILRARDFIHQPTVIPKLAQAIDYAVNQGARVVVISDGRPVGTVDAMTLTGLEDAIQRAADKGTLVVASAGNDGTNAVRIPATITDVLAVAAVDWQDAPMSWTSYGKAVDIAAPGDYVYTTMLGGKYGYFNGTSASAPIAGSLAALLFSAHPEMTPADVVKRIQETSANVDFDDSSEMKGLMGAGALRFDKALP